MVRQRKATVEKSTATKELSMLAQFDKNIFCKRLKKANKSLKIIYIEVPKQS